MVFCSFCLFFKVFAFLVVFVGVIKLYLKWTLGWCRSQTCLVGKTAIVTGSNTGIGYETALDFAKRGARVILACRNKEKAEEAREKIVKATRNENVIVRLVDMASLESVRKFAKEINETESRLDILVNNAGAGGLPDRKTEDGLLLIMQINHFAPFLLTHLLIDLLKKSTPSRIVNVASIAANYATKFNIEKLNEFTGFYYSYHNSKLCNILFTKELARRLEGTGVTTYSLHPGAVKTEIFRHSKGVMKTVIDVACNVFFKTSEEGAQTTIYCAIQKGIENLSGDHFSDCKRVPPYETAKDVGLPRKLWDKSEEFVELKPKEQKI